MSQGICFYCEREFIPANYGTNKPLAKTIDHVIAIKLGGTNKQDNKVLCCSQCNRLKADKTLRAFINKIKKLIRDGKTFKQIPHDKLAIIAGNARRHKAKVAKNTSVKVFISSAQFERFCAPSYEYPGERIAASSRNITYN